MNLKEAFRYQNKLQKLADEALSILNVPDNVVHVADTHLKHKVLAEAEDETIVKVPTTEYHEQITSMATFVLFLLEEKEKLFTAIRQAKAALPFDLDSEVAMNRLRQKAAGTFNWMNDLKGSEQLIPRGAIAYRFQADGQQIPYKCDLRRVTTINYDRTVVYNALRKLNTAADDASNKIDLCLITTVVEYQPPLDVNSSFREAFNEYVKRAGA